MTKKQTTPDRYMQDGYDYWLVQEPSADIRDDEWLDDDPNDDGEWSVEEPGFALQEAERAKVKERNVRRPVPPGAGREEPAPASKTSALTDFCLLVFKIVLVSTFLVILFMFFFGISQVTDTSMAPAIKEGDIVISYRPDTKYQSGDVVLVDTGSGIQTRRVAAVAGDTVDITSDGHLVLNGSQQIESGIYSSTYPYTDGITFPVTVGSGEIFVLGDERENAEDSRVYGCVSISATDGKAVVVIRRRGI